MKWIASDGCVIEPAMGSKRPLACDHGSVYVSEKNAGIGAGEQTTRSHQARKSGSPGVDSSILIATPALGPVSSPRRKPLKRSEPKRDWSLALAKVEEEDGCRICGARMEFLECAHILGRKFDRPISEGSKTLLVLPDRIVPLCNQLADGHHQSYDAHELDLLPYLTTAEQAQAVLDAGSIVSALKRISPEFESSRRTAA